MNRFRAFFALLPIALAGTSQVEGQECTAEFVSPPNGTCVRWFQEITFRVTCTPPVRMVVYVELGANDIVIYDECYSGSLPREFTIGFDPSALGLPDGEYTLVLDVYDACKGGKIVARDTLVLHVDTTPPTVRLLQPLDGEVVSGDVWIEGQVFDNYMGPGKWRLFINGTPVKEGFGPNVEYIWKTEGIPAGTNHTIHIVAYDRCDRGSRTFSSKVTMAATIRGKVQLGQYVGQPTDIAFKLELKQDGKLIETMHTTLDGQGCYSVVTHNIGTYDIVAKPSHWLAVKKRNVRLDGTTLLDWEFPINGDAFGDNVIDILDINRVLLGWNTSSPQSDMDGSGLTDIYDINMLLLNFALFGDR